MGASGAVACPAGPRLSGTGLFLPGVAAILLRATGHGPRTTGHRAPVLTVGGVARVAAGPLVALVPALVTLTALAATITALLLLHGHAARRRTPRTAAAD